MRWKYINAIELVNNTRYHRPIIFLIVMRPDHCDEYAMKCYEMR
jgi:hypothetical protein